MSCPEAFSSAGPFTPGSGFRVSARASGKAESPAAVSQSTPRGFGFGVAATGFGFCLCLVSAVTAPFVRSWGLGAAALAGLVLFGAGFWHVSIAAERERQEAAND